MVTFLSISGGFIMAGQLLLGLSILIILHEFGHYITAKWFGCRVEKFYLFFDPWFSLLKKKKGDTEYGIGWLPLGGYVKISGMIDESMDKEALAQPAQPWEFRSKPAWQRLIIMLGGVIMNVLVAFVIYAFVLFKWGETKTPLNSLKYGLGIQNKELRDLGLKSGDKILAVDGKELTYLEEVAEKILIGTEDRTVTLEREGKKIDVKIPKDFINKLITNKKRARGFVLPRYPSIIGKALDSSAIAYKAGLRPNDKIIAINDSVVVSFHDEIRTYAETQKDKIVNIKLLREADTITVQAKVDCNGVIGLPFVDDSLAMQLGLFKEETKKYGLAAAFPAGVRKTFSTLSSYLDQFKMFLKPETGAYKGMGGFKGMANIYGNVWDWERFWAITAMISVILAFMNLLPIPALDGGHVVFTLWEMITGRKPNEKFLEYAQIVGMVLLLGLMLFANGNDWFGWGKSNNIECPVAK
jgi:regulator of sigma E protease